MLNDAWQGFSDEISRWRDAGRMVDFWWRDDDATSPGPALARLLELSSRNEVPLALAVVPTGADAALLAEFGSAVEVLQHGVDHMNRARVGEKKTEFPDDQPAGQALERLASGRCNLTTLFGARSLAVLAPPWNRFPTGLLTRLETVGIHGYSAYGARPARSPAPKLVQVNTHADIIAWRGSRGFVGEEEALGLATRHLVARRTLQADPDEATGWLTHHACHDEAAWSFLQRLIDFTRADAGVTWHRAGQLFASRQTQ